MSGDASTEADGAMLRMTRAFRAAQRRQVEQTPGALLLTCHPDRIEASITVGTETVTVSMKIQSRAQTPDLLQLIRKRFLFALGRSH